MIHVALIPLDGMAVVWPAVVKLIDKAVQVGGGRSTVADVLSDVMTGGQTLWVAFDEDRQIKGVCTVRVVRYPEFNSCMIENIAGDDVDEWFPTGVDVIASYAKKIGCKRMEGIGRAGWEPRAKENGFTKVGVLYERRIED